MIKKYKLTNRSKQRRDVVLNLKDGSETMAHLLRGRSIEISEDAISGQLRNMLAHPRIFGLRLEEIQTTAKVKAKPKVDEEKIEEDA